MNMVVKAELEAAWTVDPFTPAIIGAGGTTPETDQIVPAGNSGSYVIDSIAFLGGEPAAGFVLVLTTTDITDDTFAIQTAPTTPLDTYVFSVRATVSATGPNPQTITVDVLVTLELSQATIKNALSFFQPSHHWIFDLGRAVDIGNDTDLSDDNIGVGSEVFVAGTDGPSQNPLDLASDFDGLGAANSESAGNYHFLATQWPDVELVPGGTVSIVWKGVVDVGAVGSNWFFSYNNTVQNTNVGIRVGTDSLNGIMFKLGITNGGDRLQVSTPFAYQSGFDAWHIMTLFQPNDGSGLKGYLDGWSTDFLDGSLPAGFRQLLIEVLQGTGAIDYWLDNLRSDGPTAGIIRGTLPGVLDATDTHVEPMLPGLGSNLNEGRAIGLSQIAFFDTEINQVQHDNIWDSMATWEGLTAFCGAAGQFTYSKWEEDTPQPRYGKFQTFPGTREWTKVNPQGGTAQQPGFVGADYDGGGNNVSAYDLDGLEYFTQSQGINGGFTQTVSAFYFVFKADPTSDDQVRYLYQQGNNNVDDLQLRIQTNGNVHFRTTAGGVQVWQTTTLDMYDDNWHFVLIQANSGDASAIEDYIEIWVDGNQAITSYTGTAGTKNWFNNFSIRTATAFFGSQGVNAAGRYIGLIDENAYFNSAKLTTAEMAYLKAGWDKFVSGEYSA